MNLARFDIEFDHEVNALYVRLGTGAVAQTIEVGPSVLVDIDANGTALGYEFIDADRFLPYLREHNGVLPQVEAWSPPQRMAV